MTFIALSWNWISPFMPDDMPLARHQGFLPYRVFAVTPLARPGRKLFHQIAGSQLTNVVLVITLMLREEANASASVDGVIVCTAAGRMFL